VDKYGKLIAISDSLTIVSDIIISSCFSSLEQQVQQLCTVVQTITNTTVESSTTNSLAAAAVQMAGNVFEV